MVSAGPWCGSAPPTRLFRPVAARCGPGAELPDPATNRCYLVTATRSEADVAFAVVEIPAKTNRHRPDFVALTVVLIRPLAPAVTVLTGEYELEPLALNCTWIFA